MSKPSSVAPRRSLAVTALPWLSVFFLVAASADAQTTGAGTGTGAAPTPAPSASSSAAAPPPATAPVTAPTPEVPDAATPAATPTAPPAASPPPAAISAPADKSDLPPGVPAAGGAAAFGEVNAGPNGAAPGEDDAQTREWKARDRDVNESATITGGTGLVHMQHAQGLAPGQFNLAFVTEYFTGNFLCTPSFPCANQTNGAQITNDSMSHIGGDLTLTMGITGWLEGYAGTSAYANSDSSNQPSLLQVLGDTDFGLKAFGSFGKILHVGGAAELWLLNGTGAVGLDGGGTSAKFRAIATADLRGTEKHTPLRFSLNLGYSVNNSGDVVSQYETQQKGIPVTRIERYGLSFNRVDHVDVGLGVEGFLLEERVRPFLEYNIMIPVNRQNYECPQVNPQGDNCLKLDQLAPSKVTLGGRFLPWKHGFGITAAFDIGITGQNDFIEEMAPIPPWTLYLGAGWTVDTAERPRPVEKVIVKESRAPAPVFGHIKGYVAEQGHPETAVQNAIVAFVNHPEITSLAAGADGHFTTLGLPVGQYDLAVKADGYKDGTCTATLVKVAAPAPVAPPPDSKTAGDATAPASTPEPTIPDVSVNCDLEALPRIGKVLGRVRDAETRNGVANVQVKLADAGGHDYTQTSDSSGTFHFDVVPPGGYQLTASADGYMNDVESIDVKPRVDTQADIVIMKRPKDPLVSVSLKEINIRQQVQFGVDSAVILPVSTALLTEIADVLNRNPRIHKVEIQGHTDSNGDDQHNQVLSEDRANSVRTWLVAHGVADDRLVAKGYGEQHPLVPNVTEGNRQKNRRVQFIIVDQDKAAVVPAGTKP